MSKHTRQTPGYNAPSGSGKPRAAITAFSTEISVEDARTIDELATSEFKVPPILIMEHAALALRDAALGMLSDSGACWIVAGPGNNGGDGVALARLMHNAGIKVRLFMIDLDRDYASEHVRSYMNVARSLGVRIDPVSNFDPAVAPELVVDAVLGTGIHGQPRNASKEAIEKINASRDIGAKNAGSKVLACDVPSGLDAQTGEIYETAVIADRTVTFVAPKPGLTKMIAQKHIGELVVAPIGIPRALTDRFVRRVDPAPRADV